MECSCNLKLTSEFCMNFGGGRGNPRNPLITFLLEKLAETDYSKETTVELTHYARKYELDLQVYYNMKHLLDMSTLLCDIDQVILLFLMNISTY